MVIPSVIRVWGRIYTPLLEYKGFPGGAVVKNPPANVGGAGDLGLIPGGREDPLEQEIATRSSILAWKIPWIEESGKLQSKESDMTEQLSTNNGV